MVAQKKQKQRPSKTAHRLTHTHHLFLALGLFIVSVLASRGQAMAGWEISVFRFLYNLPDFLHPFFFVITQLGTIYALALLTIYYAARKHYRVVLRLLLTATLAFQLSGFAKSLWGRLRPHEILLDVVNRDYIVHGPGFPSGHVALATALALTIGHYLPKKYHPIVWIWIIGVALSRVYLGIHAPLDVIGGFAIGWFCYSLFRHVRLRKDWAVIKRK